MATEDFDEAFAALRRVTTSEVAPIDVKSRVLSRTKRSRGVLIAARRWLPVAAAAAVVLIVAHDVALAHTVQIASAAGVFVDGSRFEGSLLVRSSSRITSLAAPVELQSTRWSATLAGDSAMDLQQHWFAAPEIAMRDGRLRVQAGDGVRVSAGEAVLAVDGHVEVTMTKRSKLAALAGAVAIVAVYAGRAHLRDLTVTAPGAAIIDRQGGARGVTLDEAERLVRDANDAGPEVAARGGTGAVTTGVRKTGGYWDEARQAVRFSVAGEVFDAQSGAPIEAFVLELVPAVRTFDAAVKRNYDVTGDGHFTLEGLKTGAWQLTVRAAGYAPSRQTIDLGAVTDDPYLVVPLTGGAQLTGTVVDWRGDPVADAHVVVGTATSTSDAKGNFVVKGAPEDSAFTLVATHPRYGSATMPNLRVSAGAAEHVTVPLSGILRVIGHVTRGSDAVAVARMVVKAGDVTTVTDDTGAYELFMPLDANPDVRVVSSAPRPVELKSFPKSRSVEPIRWVTAKTHVAELTKDFQLAMENGRIVGRITQGDGTPVVDARITIENTYGWAQRNQETFPAETTTDGDGRYRVDDVPAHAGYRLALVRGTDTHALGAVVIDEPGEVDASFVVAGNTLRGRFIGATTHQPFPVDARSCQDIAVARVGESGMYPLRCLDDGAFEVTDIPDGRYRVTLVAPQMRPDTKVAETLVDVPMKGGPVDVAIEGEQSTTWTVRVTNERGGFVSGLMLRYIKTKTMMTQNLELSDEGTATFSVPSSQTGIFIDAQGYAPAAVDLSGRDARSTIDVRVAR